MKVAIGNPELREWDIFLDLAREEGWRVQEREIACYQGPLARYAYVLRENGEPAGFVTCCPHQRSGWIGNLIVASRRRGHGYGRMLFEHALGSLRESGMESVWLTASEQGLPLYRQYGFEEVAMIERWRRSGVSPHTVVEQPQENAWQRLLDADRAVWCEARDILLACARRCSTLLCEGDTIALVQHDRAFHFIGPCFSVAAGVAGLAGLLGRLIPPMYEIAGGGQRAGSSSASCRGEAEIVADVLSCSNMGRCFEDAGFRCAGLNRLMRLGRTPRVHLEQMIALASPGSMG